MGLSPEEVIFLSDVVAELDAAREAGEIDRRFVNIFYEVSNPEPHLRSAETDLSAQARPDRSPAFDVISSVYALPTLDPHPTTAPSPLGSPVPCPPT